jgi:hypothetical protein
MKKANALKHVPLLKQYRKDVKAKDTLIGKLQREIADLEEVLEELDGVTVHEDFPILVEENEDESGIEIWSACDESTRYCYVSKDTSEQWRATGYKDEGSGDGKVLVEGTSRLVALRAGKDFVATGTVTTKPKEAKSPPKAKVKATA